MDTRDNMPIRRRSEDPVGSGLPSRPAPRPQPTPIAAIPTPANPSPLQASHATRKDLGFDDIPTDEDDMENVRFRDIIGAWAKQSIKHSPLEDGVKQAAAKKSRLNSLKNDLKWAMQADLDEPVKPIAKPTMNQVTPMAQPTANQPVRPQPQLQPQQQLPPVNVTADPAKTIDININFGALPKLPTSKIAQLSRATATKLKGFRFSRKWVSLTAAVAVVLIGGGVAAWQLIPGAPGAPNSGDPSSSTASTAKPEYEILLPSNTSIDALGGWHRVSPPDRDPVFAYADKIDDVVVNVSQQPLPDGFKNSTDDKVAELAKSYGATNKVTAGSSTIYIGTSASGPQSAILAKDDTLILMKSTKKITDDSWASYVESLKK